MPRRTSRGGKRASDRAGQFVTQNTGLSGAFRAFIPALLPPKPPITFDDTMREAEAKANLALGRLDGAMRYLPDPDLFLYMYVRKEAVLSSQIEGTQSSLSDLLLFEHEGTPGVPAADVEEVSRYVHALYLGVKRLAALPVSMRLLREVHRELVTGSRGGDKTPGEIRSSQNWIGGTRPGNAHFVPPPAHLLGELLGNLEKFINDRPSPPPIFKAAIAHAQFETIHPFLDGNGRVGRMLIILMLMADSILHAPLLYVSLHFKEHQAEYYERLQRIRTHGEWEEWIRFFYAGIVSVADQASETIGALTALFQRHHALLIKRGGRSSGTTLRVFDYARRNLVVSIREASRELELSRPTVSTAVDLLQRLGILRESTGRQRDRRYMYTDYLSILSSGPAAVKNESPVA